MPFKNRYAVFIEKIPGRQLHRMTNAGMIFLTEFKKIHAMVSDKAGEQFDDALTKRNRLAG